MESLLVRLGGEDGDDAAALAAAGCRVTVVDAVGPALERAAAARPDIVVAALGHTPPATACNPLARDPRLTGVPLLALLPAGSADAAVASALDAGATAALVRPVPPAVMTAWVRAVARGAARAADAGVADRAERLRRLGLALDAARVGAWQVDLATGSVRQSRAMDRLLGLGDRTAGSTADWAAVLLPDGVARMEGYLGAARDGTTEGRDEFRVRWPDGGVHTLLSTWAVLTGADGRPGMVVGVSLDVTARADEAAATRERETLFRSLAEASPLAVFRTDPAGHAVYVNARWYDFTGQAEDRGLGEGWIAAIDPEDREAMVAAWRDTVAHGADWCRAFRVRRPDGSVRWMRALGAPVRDDADAVAGWVGSVEDITVQVAAQRERDALLAAAEEANAAKDRFFAILSHELRSPLAAMVGWLAVLERHGRDPAQGQRAIAVLRRNLQAQTQLIDDLLDVSRIASGKLALARVPLDAGAVVEEVVRGMQPVAEARGLRLALVRPVEALPVLGDAHRLAQVVRNLLGNALKFTPSGGRVDVEVRRADDTVTCAVRDTGEGIAPDVLPTLFEAFRQADPSTTRRHGGLGLGLAIVRHLAAAHGGHVTAASAGPGQGACFTVRLPLAADVAVRLPTAPVRTDLRHRRVLIVDDCADTREALRAALEHAGAEVTAAGSVREALAAVARERPAVVVSDLCMPDADGYALVRALHADAGGGTRVPAIAYTGLAGAAEEARALDAGFAAHVAKPGELDALIGLIARLARAA